MTPRLVVLAVAGVVCTRLADPLLFSGLSDSGLSDSGLSVSR
jgi:hypothetical protein